MLSRPRPRQRQRRGGSTGLSDAPFPLLLPQEGVRQGGELLSCKGHSGC